MRTLKAIGAVTLLAAACGGGGGSARNDASVMVPPLADGGEDGGVSGVTANAGADRDVLAGLVVPLDGAGSVGASAYAWTQIGGDALAITNASQSAAGVLIPANAAAGATYTFQLTASAGTDSASDSVTIAVHAATFSAFVSATDTTQLQMGEGLAFNSAGLWIVDSVPAYGWVSLYDSSGTFIRKSTMAGTPLANGQPIGGLFGKDGKMIIAVRQTATAELGALDVTTNTFTLVTNALSPCSANCTLGKPSGGNAPNYALPDKDGNIFASTYSDNRVIRYDKAAGTTKVFYNNAIAMDMKPNGGDVNGMAFGPEADKLYVGTGGGTVLRIAINSDGSAGTVETYVTGLGGDVDGLTFDEAANAYIGCPGAKKLYFAPYAASGPATVTTTLTNATSTDSSNTGFINVTIAPHGSAFGDTNLYYNNLTTKVGKLPVGLRALVPPLSP